MARKIFSDEKLVTTFNELGYEYEDMKQLMIDTARGRQEVSKKEAEEEIRNMIFKVVDLNPENINNRKLFRRAMKDGKNRLFEVIEDVVDDMLVQGWSEDPFFMQFVEVKNLAEGQKNEFYTEDEVNLAVAKVSGSNHDIILQRLGEGQSFSVKGNTYGAAVGADIKKFLSGTLDWTKLINAIYKAFDNNVKNTVYNEVANIGDKLPVSSMFNKAIQLDASHKEQVDQLIEDVSAANGNVDVVILGTQTALKKLGKLTDINWISSSMKESLHETGKLGFYEGTALVEIPQRMIKKGTSLVRLIKNDQLLIVPVGMDAFIKLVKFGDAQIIEITEEGQTMDDTMSFKYNETIGVGTVVGKYFGNIKITG